MKPTGKSKVPVENRLFVCLLAQTLGERRKGGFPSADWLFLKSSLSLLVKKLISFSFSERLY